MIEGSGSESIPQTKRIRMAQKLVDPMDPEHWYSESGLAHTPIY
jgi:hypothetical protein